MIWLALATALAAVPDALIAEIASTHGLSDAQAAGLRQVLTNNDRIGQGVSPITRHPMDEAACRAQWPDGQGLTSNPDFERICGRPFMAPLYDPATQTPEQATACIDQLEFPNLPCTFPIIWVRAREAAEICTSMGKRLCDAHEWEGACAGALTPPDYAWPPAGRAAGESVKAMRTAHNLSAPRSWAYGDAYQKGICGTSGRKSPDCDGSDWKKCGSNTFPTGAFPDCRSPLGVYDLHGNAAEHMSLPLAPDQLSSTGSTTLGVTEMKGSWFVFDQVYAHEDWCRWRAPYWHGGEVMAADSHRNYHLSFRCCSTVAQ